MQAPWTVFDAMRDRHVERIWLKRDGSSWRRLCAELDDGWLPCDERVPELSATLAACEDLAGRNGAHRVDFVFRSELGLRIVIVQHAPVRGRHLAALRRLDFSTPEDAVVRDALRFARLMTAKAAVAGSPFGGGQVVIHGPPLPDYQAAKWHAAIAEEIDLCGALVTADTGISDAAAAGIAERIAALVGVKDGGGRRCAAVGAHAAFKAAVAALGKPPAEALVLVQGLGVVGAEIGRMLAADGARLVVSDKDIGRIDAFMESLAPLERKLVSVLAPYQLLDVEADVFCPCAHGQVVGPSAAASLKCRVIVGPADGQLDGATFAEELALAASLQRAGIAWVPEWIASAGAAIHGLLEDTLREAFDARAAVARTQRSCGWLTDEIMQASKRLGRSAAEVAAARLSLDEHGRIASDGVVKP